MEEYAVMLVAVLAFSVSTLVYAWEQRRARKRIQDLIRIEQTRHAFADVRNRLMNLVADEKLSSKSSTFAIIYRLSTLVMRETDNHQVISRSLQTALFSEFEHGESELQLEKDSWSGDARLLIMDLSNAMEKLMLDYSFLLRVLQRVSKHTSLIETVSYSRKRSEQKRTENDRQMKEVQSSLRELACP